MSITTQLFEGQRVRLGPIDHKLDPPVESAWTHRPDYLRGLGQQFVRPLSTAQVKKKYERIEKEMEESKNCFYFTIRAKDDQEGPGRLLGFARLYWIEWSHGSGVLQLGIGDPADRRQGYAREALDLLLHFAFYELNLYRLSAYIGEDNPAAMRLFESFSFVEEARRRKAIWRDGYYWDQLHYGLLSSEWQAQLQAEELS